MHQHRGKGVSSAYDPQVELAERWPGWRVVPAPLGGYETILPDSQLILVDTDSDDMEWQIAHMVAHLDLHMDTIEAGRSFTVQQEAQASYVADIRLDRVWARDWEVGESA